MKGLFLLGGSYKRVPGTFTLLDPVSREPTNQPLKNTYEFIHWTARERMSEKYGDYERAGLVGFKMKGVVTERDSAVVHDAEDKTHLPLPQGPGRLDAVQWVNEKLNVSVMEDEMRAFEQKILQLWDMQDLYAMTVDLDKRESSADQSGSDEISGNPAERLQKIISEGKRNTVDVSADTSEEVKVLSALRRGTTA